MRFNERQLIHLSSEKPDFEGRLHYKKVWTHYQNSKGFKERWFKLKSNILFYFKLNETRQLHLKQPSGLFILEDSEVSCEENGETPFAFSLIFKDEFDRKHLFAGRSESDVREWINALQGAKYGYLKNKLISLQDKIKLKSVEKQMAYKESHLSFQQMADEDRVSNEIHEDPPQEEDSHVLHTISTQPHDLIQF